MNCGACGKTGLRSTTLAIVISDTGAPERKRVGSCCASHGIYVVPMSRPVMVDTAKGEKKELSAVLAPFIKRIGVLAKGAKMSAEAEVGGSPENCFHAGKAEAFEATIAMLKEGRT